MMQTNMANGPKGHKGHIGCGSKTPQFIIDIINFRNDKYDEDVEKCLGSIEEYVDPKYNLIDNAINKLMFIYE